LDTLLTIIGIHAVLLGFAFTFGGFMVLSAPSKEETDAWRAQYDAAREQSRWRGFAVAARQAANARSQGLAMAVSHWPERRPARMLVYTGLICLAVAAAIGWHFGMFASQ
jgi:hypothetical protein